MYFHYYEKFTRFHDKENKTKTSFQFSYGNLYENITVWNTTYLYTDTRIIFHERKALSKSQKQFIKMYKNKLPKQICINSSFVIIYILCIFSYLFSFIIQCFSFCVEKLKTFTIGKIKSDFWDINIELLLCKINSEWNESYC